jgi:hypothetical protein
MLPVEMFMEALCLFSGLLYPGLKKIMTGLAGWLTANRLKRFSGQCQNVKRRKSKVKRDTKTAKL